MAELGIGMNRSQVRAMIAGQILSGMYANQAIVGSHPNCGWAPVNCSEEDLARTALVQADLLLYRSELMDSEGARRG